MEKEYGGIEDGIQRDRKRIRIQRGDCLSKEQGKNRFSFRKELFPAKV
nr:hypothetical protein [uncultured Acetatifactor sp.]